jgi:hypothetical protein
VKSAESNQPEDQTGCEITRDQAIEELARVLFYCMEHLDPTGRFDWETDLDESGRELYRTCVRSLLREKRLLSAALGVTSNSPTTTV